MASRELSNRRPKPSIVPPVSRWGRTVRSTYRTIYGDEFTGLSIMAEPKTAPRRSRRAQAQLLRPAILLKWRRNRRRARIRTLGRPRALFPFLKALRRKWSHSVDEFTAAKWRE